MNAMFSDLFRIGSGSISVVLTARVGLACVDGADFKPARLPGDLRAGLSACLQGKP